ncbi:MAG TPA: hypothetical protein VGN63_05630 [Flavisolibacter sp.]|jgi:hypothetical protein|nr:hypothetical protein [Flavisolibacter sp.]
MEQQKFWELLARKLAGEASLRDLYELDKVIYAEPRLQFFLRLVTDLWRNREAIEKEPGGEERFLQLLQEAYRRKYLHDISLPHKKKCFFTGKHN